jgi:hypothetical protein
LTPKAEISISAVRCPKEPGEYRKAKDSAYKVGEQSRKCSVPEVSKIVESIVSRTQKVSGYLIDRLGSRRGGRKKRKKRIITID